MTEPVRSPLFPDLSLAHRACAGVVALSLSLLQPGLAQAAPAADAPASEADVEAAAAGPAEHAPAVELPSVAEVETALADGDLSSARELAVARSEGDPSPDNYELEAMVWEALGDYERAKAAHREALETLPEDDEARAGIEARLAELEDISRGTVADEPASTQREGIDDERAARLAALAPKPPPPPEIVDTPTRKPIIEKWYFWVTVGALAASAGAIIGIAASASLSDGDASAGALGVGTGARRPVVPLGGAVFSF